ncbi:MAG: hypothetical protein ACLQAT_23895 [Candidatus Binataceae bacterium]
MSYGAINLKSSPPLTLSTNVLYGVGSVAFGVHQTALTSILMLFFNQVVGLPSQTPPPETPRQSSR